jgi:methylglutaconyl-CoA hydratase
MMAEIPAAQPVTLDVDDGVATLSLNRPELGNRYDAAMLSGMASHLSRVASDTSVRALVLRGAGRHFCVGADIDWHLAASVAPQTGAVDFLDVLLVLDALPKPVVAVVQGACIGGGVAMTACCDIVLAERSAVFAIPEVRLGFCPGALIPLFHRAIGARAFRRFGLTGERFSAETAQRLGLVADQFEGACDALLEPILGAIRLGGPVAISRTKALNAAMAPLDTGRMRALETEFTQTLRSPEAREGLAAFREKRSPRWNQDTSE